MRAIIWVLASIVGLYTAWNTPWFPDFALANSEQTIPQQTLQEARKGFVTKIVKKGERFGVPDSPARTQFKLVRYPSPVGRLAAYVTNDPRDHKKRPAIIWIVGGDNNSIGDVWTPRPRSNDQSASAFRNAGIVMMFPSQRGGNNNPGQREGFYGEVDDILAAADYLAKQRYVDPDHIYLGGHSTGGTLAMLVGECSDRFRAVYALGPVAWAEQHSDKRIFCDRKDETEMKLRSPIYWLNSVKSPMYVFEGTEGNASSLQRMEEKNTNPNIKFFILPGHNHFTYIAPTTEKIAQQIVQDYIQSKQAASEKKKGQPQKK